MILSAQPPNNIQAQNDPSRQAIRWLDAPPTSEVDVVVVGGGAAGVSAAYSLVDAQPGLRVELLEKHSIASGSTVRSAAAFRLQWRSKPHVAMSIFSAKFFKDFSKTFGVEPVFRQQGYLFLYSDADDMAAARIAVAEQRSWGVSDVEALAPYEVDRLPGLAGVFRTDHLAGATWCPSDGFLRPKEYADALKAGAAARGVSVRVGARVTDLIIRGGRMAGVVVNDGEHIIAAKTVVIAGGWWSSQVGALAGCSVPVVAVKRYLYFTPQLAHRRVEHLPLIVADMGAYARPEGNSLMMGCDERPAKPSGHESFPPPPQNFGALEDAQDAIAPGYAARDAEDYGVAVLGRLAEFMPWLVDENIGIAHVTSGYYEVTPDDKAIISEDPRLPGLFFSTGFSGHGIMHAPAAGRALAELVLGLPHTFPMEGFALAPLLNNEPRLHPDGAVI